MDIDPLPEFLMPVETAAFQRVWVDAVGEVVCIPATVFVTRQPAYPVTAESAFELRDDGSDTLPCNIQIIVKMVGVLATTGGGWRLMKGMWQVGTTFHYIHFYIPVVWTDVDPIWDSVYYSVDRRGQVPYVEPLLPRPTINVHAREDGISRIEQERRNRVWALQRRQVWHPYYYRGDGTSESSSEEAESVDEDAEVVSGGDM